MLGLHLAPLLLLQCLACLPLCLLLPLPQVYKALFDGVQVVAAKVLTGLRDERVFESFVHEVGGCGGG